MQTIVVLSFGVFLTGLGLYLGLKNFDPKYFNVIAGAIIAFLTLFGLVGKLLQDISSSDTQKQIKKNTERNLQPFVISSFQIAIEYDLTNPIISNVSEKIEKLKNQIEELYSKAPPEVNGQRMLPATPGIFAFPDNNKIKGQMIIENEAFLKSCGFIFPIIKFQLSKQYPKESKTDNGDGTYLVNVDFPVSFELQTYPQIDKSNLSRIIVDYAKNKVIFHINPIQWHYTLDNGEILSFTDLFGQFLKLSAYYNNWQDNEQKINIVSMVLINDKKKLQFIFEPAEKSKLLMEFNSAYIHQISESDFIR